MSNEIKYYVDDKGRNCAEFNNMKFYKESSGYYKINNNWNSDIPNSLRLHRAVYEYYNGKIPVNMIVHHKDGNKQNNDIDNLVLMNNKDHSIMHSKNITEEQKQIRDKNWKKANKFAAIWHKTNPKSHEVHVALGKKSWLKAPKRKRICIQCGKEFTTRGYRNSKFCSGQCKNDYRLGYSLLNIESIEYIGKHDVYNMEVKDFHNYAIDGGTIIHNCDSIRYFTYTIMRKRIEGRV